MKSALFFITCLLVAGCSAKSIENGSDARDTEEEVLHGTGLRWGMTQNVIEHTLHAHIKHGEPHHFDEYTIPSGQFDGQPALYIFMFSKEQRLNWVTVEIQRSDEASKQGPFDALPSHFINWYGKPVAVKQRTSRTGAIISLNVWTTRDNEVSLEQGHGTDRLKTVAVITAEQRVQPDQAVLVTAKEISDLQVSKAKVVEWAGIPAIIIRRSFQDTVRLNSNHPDAKDIVSSDPGFTVTTMSYHRPLSLDEPFVHTAFRSIHPEVGVYLGIDTMLGCMLEYEDLSNEPLRKSSITGMGFFDQCHKYAYDSAGWPLEPDTAIFPLIVPKHHYEVNGDLVIGR